MISKTVASGSLCSLLQLARLFCSANKPIGIKSAAVSLNNNGKLVLSDDLQRALWAQAFINLILSAQPSFKQIKKQSLHSRLMNLEWPYYEQTKGYEISKQIELEMKRFFMPKLGIYFPREVYDQERFDRGRSQEQMMTFYPTYITTHQMFKHIKNFQTILLYGKWGIGKSQSIVLYCMLSVYVNFYFFKYPDTQQFEKFYRLLEAKETIYWTISQNETMDNLIQKVYYQKPWLWKKDKSLKVDKSDYKLFKIKYNQNKETLNLSKLNNSGGIAFFDQINAVASVKRRVIQLEKQKQEIQQNSQKQKNRKRVITEKLIKKKEGMLEKLEKQSSNLNDLMQQMRKTSTIYFYNSSSNIETSLMAEKDADERTMYLYSQHGLTKPTSFDYQGQISRSKENVGMLQLAQFFTNILQEFTSFSEEVLQQWESKSTESADARKQFMTEIQDEFINTEWNSIPNAALIVQIFQKKRQQQKVEKSQGQDKGKGEEIEVLEKQIENHDIPKTIAQCKSAQALKKIILFVISVLQNNSKETLKVKLSKFLEKSGNLNADFQRKTKIKIYQTALDASLKYQDLPKEQQPLSFEFEILENQQFPKISDNIDKEIFIVRSNPQNSKIFNILCSLSPKAYRETLIETAMRKYDLIINDIINKEIFSLLVDKQNYQLGKEFDQMIVNLFDQRTRIDLCIEAKSADNQEYKKRILLYKVFKIDNFEKVQDHHKSSSSFADKFSQVFQKSEQYSSWKVCKPEQFYYSGQKKGNNYAFDIVCINGQQKYNSLQFVFVDFTLSMVEKTLQDKMKKFVKMLSQQDEFKQLAKSPSALGKDENEVLDRYKGRITFAVVSLEGKNQLLTKQQVEQLFENNKQLGNLAQNLQVKFVKCYLSNEALKKAENITQLEGNEKQILELNKTYRQGVENRKKAEIQKIYKAQTQGGNKNGQGKK